MTMALIWKFWGDGKGPFFKNTFNRYRLDSEGDIDYDELAKLPYLDAILSETLRLHSPVMRLARVANEDYKLGNTGLTIRKDQTVEIPIYALHHSEEFYDQPFKFNPDRFLPENRHLIKPYTYLPFGAGPRNCIGMRFALMEDKVGLAQVIRRFRFKRSAQTDVPLRLNRSIIVNAPKRVVVGIERRVWVVILCQHISVQRVTKKLVKIIMGKQSPCDHPYVFDPHQGWN